MKNQGINRVCCLLPQNQLRYYKDLLTVYRREFGQDNTCWAPIKDFHLCDATTLTDKILPFLKESDTKGEPVVVHCSGGSGRTGHVLAAWLVYGRGFSRKKALSAVREMGRNPLEAVQCGNATMEELCMLLQYQRWMPKCAVLYIPRAEDELYQLGTSILGYDVRASKFVHITEKLHVEGVNRDWVTKAQLYGFHLTIGNAIDFNFCDLLPIEQEIRDIIACFNPDHHFTLCQCAPFVAFWGDHSEIVVLRYSPNDYLKMLHALIVARVNPLGISSGYVQEYLKNFDQYSTSCRQKIKKFYSPWVLDDYLPHFTLLDPYTGNDYDNISRLFSEMFGQISQITLDSICLSIQTQGGEPWKIYKEFNLYHR